MNKRIILLPVLITLLYTFSCKSVFNGDSGNFVLENNSKETVEFLWIVSEGEFWPVTKSINLAGGQVFEVKGLKPGLYDIAVDLEDSRGGNILNSKKDKSKCLKIEKDLTTVWGIDENCNIIGE